jgi:hypothetical protein
MRVGVFSEEAYPLYNCSFDTLRVLKKSTDPKVVELAEFIESKKRRPRFDAWLRNQKKRTDDVGEFARWLLKQEADRGFWPGRLYPGGDPASALRWFEQSLQRLEIDGTGMGKLFAKAIEEWDRWGV